MTKKHFSFTIKEIYTKVDSCKATSLVYASITHGHIKIFNTIVSVPTDGVWGFWKHDEIRTLAKEERVFDSIGNPCIFISPYSTEREF